MLLAFSSGNKAQVNRHLSPARSKHELKPAFQRERRLFLFVLERSER
jgi:hypothetical protein